MRVDRVAMVMPVIAVAGCVTLSEHSTAVERISAEQAVDCHYIGEEMLTFGWAYSEEKRWVSVRNHVARREGDAFVVRSESTQPHRIEIGILNCGDPTVTPPKVTAEQFRPPSSLGMVRFISENTPVSEAAAILGVHWLQSYEAGVFRQAGEEPVGVHILRVGDFGIPYREKWKGAVVPGGRAYALTVAFREERSGRATNSVKIDIFLEPGGRYLVESFTDISDAVNPLNPLIYFWVRDVQSDRIVAGNPPPAKYRLNAMQDRERMERARRGDAVPDASAGPSIDSFVEYLNSL